MFKIFEIWEKGHVIKNFASIACSVSTSKDRKRKRGPLSSLDHLSSDCCGSSVFPSLTSAEVFGNAWADDLDRQGSTRIDLLLRIGSCRFDCKSKRLVEESWLWAREWILLLEISQDRYSLIVDHCAFYCNARTLILICLSCWLKCWIRFKNIFSADCASSKVNCLSWHMRCVILWILTCIYFSCRRFRRIWISSWQVGRSTGASTIV